jgi:hypothetical protein
LRVLACKCAYIRFLPVSSPLLHMSKRIVFACLVCLFLPVSLLLLHFSKRLVVACLVCLFVCVCVSVCVCVCVCVCVYLSPHSCYIFLNALSFHVRCCSAFYSLVKNGFRQFHPVAAISSTRRLILDVWRGDSNAIFMLDKEHI